MMESLPRLVVDANDVIEFKLVRYPEDIQDDTKSFGPKMCHQSFGENESIYGYSDLHIQLFYSAASLQTYLGISYSSKIDSLKYDGVKPDNIVEKLSDILPTTYSTNIEDFIKSLSKDDIFLPSGTLIHSFSIPYGISERQFEIYYCETKTPNFLPFHARLQTFLLWYIDAASFVDTEDDQWTFFILYEKYRKPEGDNRWAVAGMCSVYRYYAYPLHIRPRISQVLVLPPFQRIGLGAQLLQAIYLHFITVSTVIDITVEDASIEFQRIRDFVDAKNCEKLPAFAPKNLINGFNKEMAIQAQNKLKINNRQARRIYEILRLKNTNISEPKEYLAYRLDVKNRLNVPYQRQKQYFKKMKDILKPEEYAMAAAALDIEQVHLRLNKQYGSLEEQYKQVIERLELSE